MTKANQLAAQQRMQPIYPVTPLVLPGGQISATTIAGRVIEVSQASSRHRISSALSSLSSVVSVNLPLGIFQINVLGVLAKVVEYLES